LFKWRIINILISKIYLHPVNSLSWWLALSTPDILITLMNQSVSQRTVCHRMFVHIIILKVRHHISKSCLGCRFGSLLLYLIHLFQVLLCCWI
jgi:hypothetical protein